MRSIVSSRHIEQHWWEDIVICREMVTVVRGARKCVVLQNYMNYMESSIHGGSNGGSCGASWWYLVSEICLRRGHSRSLNNKQDECFKTNASQNFMDQNLFWWRCHSDYRRGLIDNPKYAFVTVGISNHTCKAIEASNNATRMTRNQCHGCGVHCANIRAISTVAAQSNNTIPPVPGIVKARKD
jgi:hypothetical protein